MRWNGITLKEIFILEAYDEVEMGPPMRKRMSRGVSVYVCRLKHLCVCVSD